MTIDAGGGGPFPVAAWARTITGVDWSSDSQRVKKRTRAIFEQQIADARARAGRTPPINPTRPAPAPASSSGPPRRARVGRPKGKFRRNPEWQRCVDESGGGDFALELCDQRYRRDLPTWDPAPGPLDGEWQPQQPGQWDRIERNEPPTITDDEPAWILPEQWKPPKRDDVIQARGPYSLPDIPPPVAVPQPRTPGPIWEGLSRAARLTSWIWRLYPYAIILQPQRTSETDVIFQDDYERTDIEIDTQPDPQPIPKGPTRRARVGRVEVGTIFDDDPMGGYRGPIPEPERDPLPGTRTRPRPWPRPGVLRDPVAIPKPGPVRLPVPKPLPRLPKWPRLPFDPLYLVPLLLPQLRPPGRPSRLGAPRPTFQPSTPAQPQPYPFGLMQPGRADPCEARETKKRRKRSCSNPIVSKRTRRKGGVLYQTITRKLTCPVSSRKKPRSRRVP